MARDDRPAFEDTQQALPISLLRTREMVMDQFRPMLAELGVTEQQWRVLRVLHEAETADASTVAHAACLKLPSLTRITRRLADAGYVAVTRDSEDGRRMLLSITPEGRAFLDGALPRVNATYARIEAAIGSDRLADLLQTLVDVRTALNSDTAPDL